MKRGRRGRRIARVAVFVSAALILLAALGYFATMRRSTAREIDRLQTVRDNLHMIADPLKTARAQAEEDKRIVLEVLSVCRSAEDIPHLGGNRIIARHQGYESLGFYIPEGSHTLEISSFWQPASTVSPSPFPSANGAKADGEKTWRVPLRPASGYWLTVRSRRDGRPIQWELTSNDPEFETRSDTIPLKGFSQRGGSWSGSGVVRYPNQIERYSPRDLPAMANAPPGVRLMNTKLNGLLHEQPYEVAFAVHVRSDGPACVTASDAHRVLILKQGHLLLPYKGGGKYELRSDNEVVKEM